VQDIWLAGFVDLAGVRARGDFDRPF
jgi:hypothetical protein